MSEAQETAAPPKSIAGRMIGGAAVSFVSMIVVRVLGIANLAILGRLLSPGDFGIVALAMVVIGLMDALLSNQFEVSLIRRRAKDADEFNTAFAMALLVALAAVMLVLAIAWPMAAYMNQPDLAWVLVALCAVPILTGLRNPYFNQYKMDLNQIPFAVAMSVSRLILIIVAVGWALIWPSHWAIVAGTIAMGVTHTLLTYTMRPKFPRWGLVHGREYLRFGGWLTLAAGVSFLQRRFPALVIGRMSGVYATGLFNMGVEVSTTLTLQLITPLANNVLPGLSAIQDDVARLKRGYLTVQEALLGMSLPMGVGIALIAPELVRLGLGNQWLEAVPIIQVLAPITALMALTVGVQSIIFIDGNTRGMFLRNITVLAFVAVGSLTGVHLAGVMGAVIATGLGMLLSLYLTLRMAQGSGMGAPSEPMIVSWRSIVSVAAMAGAVILGADVLFLDVPLEKLAVSDAGIIILAKVAGGGAVYGAVHMILWRLVGRPQGFETILLKLFGRIFGRLRWS